MAQNNILIVNARQRQIRHPLMTQKRTEDNGRARRGYQVNESISGVPVPLQELGLDPFPFDIE